MRCGGSPIGRKLLLPAGNTWTRSSPSGAHLLFGLVIYVFQLRIQLLENPNVPRDGKLVRFTDQVFANVNYAVVVGGLTTVASVGAGLTADDHGNISSIWSGLIVALGVHLILVVFMCIKRVRAAYREIKSLPRTTRV